MRTAGEIMIKIEKLYKNFKEKKLFEDVNLHINRGEICGIIGKNGAGKSVLLKMIAGVMYPTKGTIVIDDIPLKEGSFPEDIGIVLDNIGFLREYSGFKNLKLIASILNKVSDERIKEVMQSVGLNPEDKTKVGKYSLGMRQKLALAQAIMEYPKLILLDEPFNGLDEESAECIKELLIKINKNEKVTMLIISHDKEDLVSFCDRIIKIENKKLKACNL